MHTKNLLRAILAAFAVMVMAFSPVGAVTDGEVASDADYPYVGLMVAQDADGNPLWRCSGTLLSSRLFLTAGHCTESPAAHVEIWFDADVESGIPDNGYPYTGWVGGTPYTHPQYDPNAFYLYDVGVVVLDKPLKMDRYGALPEYDQLDAYGQGAEFTAVGYGLQKSYPDAASWKNEALRIRMISYPQIIQINQGIVGSEMLLLSNNANTGGTCFGDSGGPNFIGETNIVGGVTSFGRNGTCAGTGGVYRIDRADDLNWIYNNFGKYLK